MKKVSPGVGPKQPQVVVLVGATGDLSRRKLLPGLFHLVNDGFIPGCRVIGISLDDGSVKNLGRYAASGIAWWPKRPSSTAALT